jgi:hypothetical protein
MAVAYDIKAIPTVYGARQFRSRLEAKWASFFDLCGWQFEYEPFDLGEWSPDFLLLGETKVLVEVKPITAFDKDTADRMERAAMSALWDGELLLVGVAPLFSSPCSWSSGAIGWLGEPAYSHSDVAHDSFFFDPCPACIAPNDSADFHSDTMAYVGRMFGARYRENSYPPDSDWLKRLWDRAANRVQWHKSGRQA